jgi:1-acyl-sn-glycerol-3-phosphate acyltransferase
MAARRPLPLRLADGNHHMIVSIVVFLVVVILSIPSAVVLIPLTMITGNPASLYNVSCAIVRIAFRAAGIRLQVHGRENFPVGHACIFMANHVSNLDPPALLSNLPGRTAVFLKHSLMNIPVLGYAFKLGEFIPVARSGNAASAQESVAAATRLVQKGVHIMTFVEGTRSKDGRLLPFKKGPFYLAFETGAPCIPVSIYGTEKLMPRGSSAIKRGTAHIVFHAPVHPRDFASREELLRVVREAIASGLPESMRP